MKFIHHELSSLIGLFECTMVQILAALCRSQNQNHNYSELEFTYLIWSTLVYNYYFPVKKNNSHR